MLKNFLFILTLTLTTNLMSLSVSAQDKKEDCSCPQVTCGPCQKKVTLGKIVRFCDWGDINVCKKVVCENVNYYFGCLSKLDQDNKKKAEEEKLASGDLVLPYDSEDAKKSKSQKRQISSVGKKEENGKVKFETEGLIEANNETRVLEGVVYSEVVVGKVKAHKGKLSLMQRGKTVNLASGQSLYVGDEISNTNAKSQNLSLEFENGVVGLELEPKSKILVQDPHSIVGRFQPFFYLVYGGVKAKSEMKEGSFDLLAGQILIRSKNSNSEVRYEMEHGQLKVKVESQKGDLEVMKAQDLSGQSILVQEGNFVSWMSETLANLFTSDEKAALAGEGFITPVFEMNLARKESLGLIKKEVTAPVFADWSMNSKDDRAPASSDDGICQSPQAEFQQCAWTCEGNKKGAKECLAGSPNTHCVRRVCNAAGQWGVATPFASSYRDLCPAEGTRVGDCSP